LVADLSNPDNNIRVGTDSPKTVLIVDNQPREITALQKQLAFAGFRTEIATTGAGAIKIVEEHPPDIVLLEASLSDIDSVEVVAFIRSDLRTCRMPILAMSVLPHMKGRCLKGGCDDFLQKPVKILDLVARIRKSLR
jgi:DNA-binding response OmpR family regulator